MVRTRRNLAPTVVMQQIIDGRFAHFASDFFFIGAVNAPNFENAADDGFLGEPLKQLALLFLERQIFMVTPTAWLQLQRCDALFAPTAVHITNCS